jgi:Rieske Fe-S protein
MAGVVAPFSISAMGKGNKQKAYKAIQNEQNEVLIPLALFATQKVQVVTVKGWDYDMAVMQKEDQSYAVFLLKCTHMDNPIHLSSEGFVCTMHGSTYNQSGEVTKGPAEKPLEQYLASIRADQIVITAS